MSEQSAPAAAPATVNRSGIPVVIFDKYVEVMDSRGMVKYISLPEFVMSLGEVTETVNEEIVDILPPEVYAISRSATEMSIAMYIPERIVTLKHGDREFTIPWPNTIMVAVLKKRDESPNSWTKSIVKYFCTPKSLGELNGKIPTAYSRDEQIFRMPFPNFYDTLEMCFGGNTMPVAFLHGDFRALKYYYDVIALSPFNDDLGTHGFNDVSGPRDLFKQLSECTEFPYARLR